MPNEIRKQLELNKLEYYETHLSILNCILPKKATPTEIQVLSLFMALEGDISLDRFGSTSRKIIRTKLKISSSGLSNYIRTLKVKEFLLENESGIKILPLLFPEKDHQLYLIKLVNTG